jgi:hypothetical protein
MEAMRAAPATASGLTAEDLATEEEI